MKSKKSLKWIVSIAMVVALLLTTLVTVAAATVEYTLSSATVIAGEEVEVTLSVTGEDVSVFVAQLTYDTAALTFNGYESLVPGATVSASASGMYYSNSAAPELGGEVITLKFKASETANGPYSIGITMSAVISSGYTSITDYTATGGTVSVVNPVTGVTVAPTSATINVGGTIDLEETVTPANATNKSVTWSSSDPSVASVTASGVVNGVSVGTATITVKTEDGGFEATSVITVQKPVSGVTVLPASATINVGGTVDLEETVAPADASNKNVTWSSSDSDVASVNASGVVTGKSAGTATITVKTEDGGFKATSVITVQQQVTGVSVTPAFASIYVDETTTLAPQVIPANSHNQAVTWSSSDESVATVSNGVVTGKSAGTATITVKTEDGGFEATSVITVLQQVTGVELEAAVTMEIGEIKQLTATVLPLNAENKNVTWESSKPGVASIDANGNVTAIKGGKTTITVKTEDRGFEASCVVTVNTRTIALNVTSGQDLWLPITVDDCDGLVGLTGKLNYDSALLTLKSVVSNEGFVLTTGLNDPTKDDNKFNVAYLSDPNNGVDGTVVVGYAIFTAKADLQEDITTYVTVDLEEAYNGQREDIEDVTAPKYAVSIKPVPPLPGDANLNNVIDLPDAILILQHLSRNNELTGRALKAADANCDGMVNTVDAVLVMMALLP